MPVEGKRIERLGIRPESKEEKEIKLEDVFEHDIEEIRKKIEKNPLIDAFDKEHYFLPDLLKKQEIEEFSKKNPKRFREILGKLREFYPKGRIEEKKERLKTDDEEFIKEYLAYRNFSKLKKIENLNPSREIRKFVDKIVSLNGILDQESLEILKEVIDLKPNRKEVELLEKMAEISIEPKIDFSWVDFLKATRGNRLGVEEKKWLEIFSDKKKFEKLKVDIKGIEKKLGDSNINFISQWQPSLKIGDDSKKEKIFSETDIIKNIIQNYNLQWLMDGEWLLNFNNLPNKTKEGILSPDLRQKFKEFKLDAKFFELDDIYKIFGENEKEILTKGDRIKKLISEFKIEKVNKSKFQNVLSFPDRTLDKIAERDFSSLPKEIEELLEESSYYKQASSKIFENIRKTKGDLVAKDISRQLLKYISLSQTLSYLSFQKPPKSVLNKLHKLEKSYPTLRNKILDPRYNLKLEDVVIGQRATERMVGRGNIEYLSAAHKLGIPWDAFGIFGYDLEEIKNYVRAKAKEIIYDYDKERYKQTLPSVVGYAAEYPEAVNEILKIENLWDFKISQEPELFKILESVKNLKIKPKDKIKRGNKEIYLDSVEILKKPEEYLAAINIEPTCMSPVGDFNYGALTIAAGPFPVAALKNKQGEIVGIQFILPVEDKKNGKWRFELNPVYGAGEEYLSKFILKMEKILREKNKDYYEGVGEIVTRDLIEGRIPKSKAIPSLDPGLRKFWRDGWGMVNLEEAK